MYKLLVVDDEQLERQAVRFIIERNCPDVSIVGEAGDGLTAVHAAARVKPDIVLMDIQMPNMNGLDAVKRIQGILPQTKIMLLTAADEPRYRQQAAQLGVDEYILKPVRPDKLVHMLRCTLTQVEKATRMASVHYTVG